MAMAFPDRLLNGTVLNTIPVVKSNRTENLDINFMVDRIQLWRYTVY